MAGHGSRSNFMMAAIWVALFNVVAVQADRLKEQLGAAPFQIVHESYVNNNWELFLMDADGGNPVNLTRTPDRHELYPQVSPDGSQVCFLVDTGKGRDTVRSLEVMNTDGSRRRKITDRARQPCWAPDSQIIAYMPQEYDKFNIADYYTRGIMFHHLPSGRVRHHPNNAKLHHLYNIKLCAQRKVDCRYGPRRDGL